MNTLSVSHISKSFGTRRVVSDVSLEAHSGEVVGLLGPNGAGKTTSFSMIVGLIASDSGSIHINDQEVSLMRMDKRARLGLGYLPQEGSIFGALTVEENIKAILETSPRIEATSIAARLETLLEEFRISHLRNSPGSGLSGGERRRVEIARALATDPHFLLLDEPFAGVDPISIHDIQSTIRQLASHDIGIIITDHNVRETLNICHRSYIISGGRVLAAGSATEIVQNKQVREAYLGEQFQM